MRLAAALALLVILGCAPAQPAAVSQSPAKSAPQVAEAPRPAAEVKPAASTSSAAEKPAAPAPSRLLMGTAAATSSYYAYTVALVKLLQSKMPNLSVTLSSAGGGVENAKRASEGKVDLALAGLVGLYPLYAGLDPAWKDQPLKDIRTLWVFDPLAYAWFVREETGVTSVEQLQGKDFNASGKGTAQEVLARLLVFPALGIEPRWYVGGQDDALAAVKDRRIVGSGKATSIKHPDALMLDAMTAMKIRVLSWTPELVQKVRSKYPFLGTVEIPAGVYKAEWNEKPITTWGDGIGIWTLARFSSDLAYQMTKAAVEDNKAGGEGIQAATFTPLKEFDIAELTMSLSPYPLHVGAQKYFVEIGAKIPDHLRPPEAK